MNVTADAAITFSFARISRQMLLKIPNVVACLLGIMFDRFVLLFQRGAVMRLQKYDIATGLSCWDC